MGTRLMNRVKQKAEMGGGGNPVTLRASSRWMLDGGLARHESRRKTFVNALVT